MEQGKRKEQQEFSEMMVLGAMGGIIGVLIFCLVAVVIAGVWG
tara:strand:+ start:390 stop:518 length:129 start_codon:yes stop_codon:yes gene_type:complete